MKTRLLVRAVTGALVSLLLLLPAVLRADEADIAPVRAKAEKGNAVAQYNLGLLYAEGQAVPRDRVEAYVWLSLAAENGTTGKALSVLTGEMTANQLQAAKIRLNELRTAAPTVISSRPSAPAHAAAAVTPSAAPSAAPASPPPEAAPAASETPPAAAVASPPAEDRAIALEKELATLNADKTKLSEELASAWKEADSAKAAGEALQQERARLAASVQQLTEENAALNRQLADRGDAAKHLAAVTSRFEDARKELLVLKNDNAELNDNLQAVTRERDRLSKAVRNEQSTHQLEEAQAAIARLQREKADLQTEQASLTTRLAETAAAATASVAAATAGSADELVRLKQELAKSGEKVDMTVRSFALTQQENDQLKARIGQADSERAAAVAQAQDAGKRTADAEAALTKTQQELAALRATAEHDAGEAATLKTRLADVTKGSESSSAEVTRLTGELAALKTQLAGATSSGESTSAEVTRLNGELAALHATADHDASEAATLRTQLADAMKNSESSSTEVARLTGELAAARDTANKATADNASLRESLRQMQNTGAGLVSENARLRTALALAGSAPAATSQPTRPAPATVAASAPAAPAPATPPPAPRMYRVASGDTLTKISSRYYGTTARWQDIYNANRDQLRSPDVLPLGVELKIP
jgi:DNA repair exonuclease SbcCD ATPase subunit/phage tail protein X